MKIKSIKKISVYIFLVGIFTFAVSGCSSSSKDTIVLRILNMEDYIYLNNPKLGYNEPNLYDGQFKAYIKDNYPEFANKNIEVIYDTTDTNETLYSKIQTGKANYDLICTSDYMMQKLMAEDRIVKLDHSLVPNYFPSNDHTSYVAPYLLDVCKNINTTTYKTKEVRNFNDYCVGYTWGTLGIAFNPTFPDFANSGINKLVDFTDWSTLWNSTIKGTFSIKNSMRDTYAVGVMETFKDEFLTLKEKYRAGGLTSSSYNQQLSDIFNRSDATNARKVFDTLYPLKDNAFGFEVDSGKEDIVTKKIGAVISWSGDAGYSIYQASDRFQVSNPFDIYYSVPSSGSNIWIDAWAMPKIDRSDDQCRLAHAFLNFLSDPVYAAKNMDYNGYTTFIGGAEVRDYVLDSYDARTDCIYVLDEQPDKDVYYSIFYIDPHTKKLTEVSYADFDEYKPEYNDVELRYYKGNCEYSNENGFFIDPDSGKKITFDSPKMTKMNEKYNDRLIIKDSWDTINLKYVFENTIEEAAEDDYVFYSDDYYLVGSAEEGGIVGGKFFAQYPDHETITRCAVMRDYRENNPNILKLWEEFKSNSLPVWAIVLFSIEAVIALAIIGIIAAKKISKNTIRKNRKKSEKTNKAINNKMEK